MAVAGGPGLRKAVAREACLSIPGRWSSAPAKTRGKVESGCLLAIKGSRVSRWDNRMMALRQSRGSVEGKGAHEGVDLGRTIVGFLLLFFKGKEEGKKEPCSRPSPTARLCVHAYAH